MEIFKDKFKSIIFKIKVQKNSVNFKNKENLKQTAAVLMEYNGKIKRKGRIRKSMYYELFFSIKDFFPTPCLIFLKNFFRYILIQVHPIFP